MATNCCRLCLSTEDGVMEDIFSDNEMPQKIFDCFSIEVKETSELPTKICEVCKSVLIIWWKFKRQCLEANDKLQDSFPHLFNPYKIEVLEDEVSLSDQEDQVELYSVVDNESDNEIKEEEEKELVIEYNECEDEGHIQEAEDSQSNIDGMEFALEYEDAKPQEFDKIEEDKEESSGKGTQVLLYETITEGGEDFKLKTSKGNNLKLLGMVNKKDNNLQMNTYKIVETVEDGKKCLTAVPSCWENDGFLYWPSNKKAADTLRKKCTFPTPSWSKEKCIVKRDGIPSISDALKIERHMSELNGIESEMENQNKSKKRNHPALTTSQVFNYNTKLGFATSAKKQRMSGKVEKAKENVLVINSPKTSHSNVDCIEADTFDNESTDEIAILPDTPIKITDYLHKTGSVFIDHSGSNTSGTQQILAEINNIGLQQNAMFEAIARIEKQQSKLVEFLGSSQSQNVTAKDDDIIWITNNIPINSIPNLRSLEEKLLGDAFKNKLIKVLSRICGRDGKQNGWAVAYKIVDRFIRRETVNLFSWTGVPKKIESQAKPAYSRYVNVMEAFYDVIKLSDINYTMEMNTKFFKSIVKNSQRRFLEEKDKLIRPAISMKKKGKDGAGNNDANKENESSGPAPTVHTNENESSQTSASAQTH